MGEGSLPGISLRRRAYCSPIPLSSFLPFPEGRQIKPRADRPATSPQQTSAGAAQ